MMALRHNRFKIGLVQEYTHIIRLLVPYSVRITVKGRAQAARRGLLKELSVQKSARRRRGCEKRGCAWIGYIYKEREYV